MKLVKSDTKVHTPTQRHIYTRRSMLEYIEINILYTAIWTLTDLKKKKGSSFVITFQTSAMMH